MSDPIVQGYLQWERGISLTISNENRILDLSDLHIIFDVKSYFNKTPKTLRCRVYNIKDDTATSLAQGGEIVLQAGYQNNIGTIFSGQLIQFRKGREKGCDTFIDLTATDSDAFFSGGFSTTSIAAGTSLNGVIYQLSQGGTVPLNVDQKQINTNQPITDNTIIRGRSYFGMTKDYLSCSLAAAGASWTVQNNQLAVTGNNLGTNPSNIPLISAATGLIDIPTQTIEGIQCKVLLNPNLYQNMFIELNTKDIILKELAINQIGQSNPTGANASSYESGGYGNLPQPSSTDSGTYKILYVTHNGDTRGNSWFTDFVCYMPVGGSLTPAQAAYLPA